MIVDRRSTDGQPTVKAKMRGRTKEERRTKWSKWTEQIFNIQPGLGAQNRGKRDL